MTGPTDFDTAGIEQPVPRPSAAFLMIAIGRRLRERLETILAAEGIAPRHLSVLGHLSRDPGMSYSELARRAAVTPQSMQATVTALEERGAVDKSTDAGRGRTARLYVTGEGLRLLRAGRAAYTELDELVSRHTDPGTLAPLLPALAAVLRDLTEQDDN